MINIESLSPCKLGRKITWSLFSTDSAVESICFWQKIRFMLWFWASIGSQKKLKWVHANFCNHISLLRTRTSCFISPKQILNVKLLDENENIKWLFGWNFWCERQVCKLGLNIQSDAFLDKQSNCLILTWFS